METGEGDDGPASKLRESRDVTSVYRFKGTNNRLSGIGKRGSINHNQRRKEDK